MFAIHGPLLFGATDKFIAWSQSSRGTGAGRDREAPEHDRNRRDQLRALEDLADRIHRSGRELSLCGAPPAARGADGASRVPRPRRRTEHLSEHQDGARARGRLHGLFLAEAGNDPTNGRGIGHLNPTPRIVAIPARTRPNAEIGTHRMPDVMLGSYADLLVRGLRSPRKCRRSRRRGLRTDDDRHDFRARGRQPGARAPGRRP